MVNSIAVTYFVGTSRWCKEVGLTYQLDPQLIEQGQVNKRRNFPWALLSMTVIIVVAAFGAMADIRAGSNLSHPERTARVDYAPFSFGV